MKTKCLLFFVCLTTLNMFATQPSFPDTWYCIDEQRWTSANPNEEICVLNSAKYMLANDTVVADIQYTNILYQREFNDEVINKNICGLRFNSDSSKVYIRPWNFNSNDEYLLYDYTIKIGDTCNAFVRGVGDCEIQNAYYIDSVVLPLVCKNMELKDNHRYFTMECEYNKQYGLKYSFVWIQGIGTEYGLFAKTHTFNSLDENYSDHPLLCATRNGETLFTRPNEELKHIGHHGVKNYCTSFEEINTAVDMIKEEIDSDAPIYNILGQQVGKNYRGIVIKNGKKYLKL